MSPIRPPSRWRWLLPIAAISLLAGVGLIHFASPDPDGLDSVAEKHGFAEQGRQLHDAPAPDYQVSWWRGPMGRSIVGLVGMLVTFGLLVGVGRALARRRRRSRTDRGQGEPGRGSSGPP